MSENSIHNTVNGTLADASFKYRTIPVTRLSEIQNEIDSFFNEDKISSNETFRSYLDGAFYGVPDSFPDAKSVIILAVYTPLAYADFHYKNMKHELAVPPQYYSTGLKEENLVETIQKKIILESGFKVERATGMLLKRLAVKSGLARYGRNNITYVEGMGSFLTLYAFFTDYLFEDNGWDEVKMLDECENCRICRNRCPTGAIRDDPFVIDAGKCVSLYNEVPGEFPDWIPSEAHNALMGCMGCQGFCPANRDVMKKSIKLGTITEKETIAILEEQPNDELIKSLSEKLRNYPPGASLEHFPMFTRNLGVLLKKN